MGWKVGKKVKANRVILSLVFLFLGFLVAFSYQITKKEQEEMMTDMEWERNIKLREELNKLEEHNLELQNKLFEKQKEILAIEKAMAEEEGLLALYISDIENLRLMLGKVKVQGTGIKVTLDDGEYDPLSGDINQFLVHEHHVFKVINELYISGAEAVAIGGKRLTKNSYIVCNGPVITVDGEQFPAPFVITAIGEPEVLEKALNIQGGVIDQLVNDNIVVKVEKSAKIEMDPILSSGN